MKKSIAYAFLAIVSLVGMNAYADWPGYYSRQVINLWGRDSDCFESTDAAKKACYDQAVDECYAFESIKSFKVDQGHGCVTQVVCQLFSDCPERDHSSSTARRTPAKTRPIAPSPDDNP